MALGAHYDKYDPISGGFRAPLAAAVDAAGAFTVVGASLDANGRVVRGAAGNTGFLGVNVAHGVRGIGEVVDIMTDGEIVDVPGLVAGTVYYLSAAGALEAVAPAAGANKLRVGHTVEADRLIVRVQLVQG